MTTATVYGPSSTVHCGSVDDDASWIDDGWTNGHDDGRYRIDIRWPDGRTRRITTDDLNTGHDIMSIRGVVSAVMTDTDTGYPVSMMARARRT